ncbi:MAG TPA: bifunctional DNA-binding transcriptional regulator/O6-methylguanine-DNA methyltransferase Ada [Gemmatimonadaceae bacterium]|nr:bifunctional DNA-binding transcriptional regulator/O6-methylguanine-DNA methyltransferase Ada [Gemmatimonadaceae bacterium]
MPAPSSAWAAVMERDRRFDGVFVYAVRTTGVYCRPSCPSRRPLRENVRFFPSPEDAERGGFRECKRCRPRAAMATTGAARAVRAKEYIDAHLDEPLTLDALARAVKLSPYHLQRVFKAYVGLSPKKYRDAKRLERFKARVKEGDTVSRATYEAGFGSSRTLYAAAEAGLGMSPASYRRGGLGVHIRYAITRTAFGRLLVAATERGVCAVSLGESVEELEGGLRREFPRADITRADDALSEWVRAIVAHLEGESTALAVPTDLHGTEFQMRVWRALREIPYGDTRSYGEIARSIGQPAAVRAVARACAGNRVALVVPCHRVVREGGALGGYRWGVERKRRLLEQERARSARAPRPGADGAE